MTSEHDWPDDNHEYGQIEVRHVQPYQAEKVYRCPGCDHEIRPGEGHEVVIPLDAPEDRRHWHGGCWHREQKKASKQPKQPKKRR